MNKKEIDEIRDLDVSGGLCNAWVIDISFVLMDKNISQIVTRYAKEIQDALVETLTDMSDDILILLKNKLKENYDTTRSL